MHWQEFAPRISEGFTFCSGKTEATWNPVDLQELRPGTQRSHWNQCEGQRQRDSRKRTSPSKRGSRSKVTRQPEGEVEPWSALIRDQHIPQAMCWSLREREVQGREERDWENVKKPTWITRKQTKHANRGNEKDKKRWESLVWCFGWERESLNRREREREREAVRMCFPPQKLCGD